MTKKLSKFERVVQKQADASDAKKTLYTEICTEDEDADLVIEVYMDENWHLCIRKEENIITLDHDQAAPLVKTLTEIFL